MTDYDDKEISTDEGAPVELFEWIGSYRSYYMTSDAVPHVYSSHTYLPVSGLLRSEIKAATHEEDNTDVTVDLPITEQLVKDYGFQTTPPKLDLIIHRMHRDALTVVPYWKGKVASIVVENNMAKLRIPSRFGSILQGNIPTVYIQPPCNNVLFDQRCKVSRVANSLDTTVATVNGRTITIPTLGGFPEGWFIGGEIVIPSRNERRMIIAQAGTALTVNYAFARISQGMSIQVTSGCDHSFTSPGGCPKYNNQRNYGGAPYVPGETKNPFPAGVR